MMVDEYLGLWPQRAHHLGAGRGGRLDPELWPQLVQHDLHVGYPSAVVLQRRVRASCEAGGTSDHASGGIDGGGHSDLPEADPGIRRAESLRSVSIDYRLHGTADLGGFVLGVFWKRATASACA